jgi:hypothetical protein
MIPVLLGIRMEHGVQKGARVQVTQVDGTEPGIGEPIEQRLLDGRCSGLRSANVEDADGHGSG